MNGRQDLRSPLAALLVGALLIAAPPAEAQDSDADLAQELTNPLASLITLPIQLNYDSGLGPLDDWRLRFQAKFVFSK
jgi:hypothetical protein